VDCEIEGMEGPLGKDREQYSTDRGERKVLGDLKGDGQICRESRNRPYRCKFGEGMRRIRTAWKSVLRT
jgi:hypothetical protein